MNVLAKIRGWFNQPIKFEPPPASKFRHVLRADYCGGADLVVQEHLTSVSVEGVIYYEDLRRVAYTLLKIANLNSDIC